MDRMDAMTIKMDAQYKELQNRLKQSTSDPDEDDTPISREEEANDDEDEEPTPQQKTKTTKPIEETQLPKPYKPNIPYPQRLRKEKMEAQYGKFLDMIPFLSDESSAMIQNKVPLKLGDPGTFLIPCNFNKTFSCNALADLGASINLMPYSLYVKLSLKNLKPTRMSVRLADRSLQYHVGIAENMLVKVGKFTFPADFVILEMEEDSKVPLILGRPFLHTADAVIRVKQKQLNLRVRTERMTFNIDSAMKHSYSNDDTRTILEEELFAEFDEFIPMTENENYESNIGEPKFKKITINTDYKIKTSLEEHPTDLELKPLPENLKYIFFEEPSLLPVIISSQLSNKNKNKLVSILKKHKEAFAWKTTNIPGICPSFYKHKRNLIDDKKPVVKKQRRLNPNMQEVVKEEIVKLLDTGIIYQIADSPWVSPIHCVPKKGDKKGTENIAADHLSRIDNDETSDESEIDDNFLEETLLEINTKNEPWFADFANYLVGDIIPKGMTYQQNNKFFSDLKYYFWEEPYLFRICSDGMIRRCVYGPETRTILDQCHHGPTSGHYKPNITAKKVLDSVFYWLSIIKEAYTLGRLCEACQNTGNISKLDEIPLTNIQVCEIFDVWGIDFMGPFPKSHKFEYILVVIDYVSKWVKAQALPTNDARVVITFLKKVFCHFGMPKTLISDRALKRILEKTVKDNHAIWSRKLDDALWAFHTAYKTPTGTTPYKLIYGKNCHLPFEIEHRAYWALKNCNPDLIAAGEKRMYNRSLEGNPVVHALHDLSILYASGSNLEASELVLDYHLLDRSEVNL
ncbi:reverse transcriptase domain-containing protein [Tanacetum coccineum]